MATRSYTNGYEDKLSFWNEQLLKAQSMSIERPRYTEERCKESILYFTAKHEEWKTDNEGSNPPLSPTYYRGDEVTWSTEDVMRIAKEQDVKLNESEALSVLVATFEDNEDIMQFIHDEMADTIGKLKTIL